MNRRRRRLLLACAAAGGLWWLASGHTPYRQWAVYRARHLLVGTSRADAPSYPLGQQVAALLAAALPESRARVSRAPDQRRLASLLGTGQMPLALLSRADAAALMRGSGMFERTGRVELTALFRFGDHFLVSRPDFPEHHAYLVVEALHEHARHIAGAALPVAAEGPLPLHAGARAYAEGRAPAPAAAGN